MFTGHPVFLSDNERDEHQKTDDEDDGVEGRKDLHKWQGSDLYRDYRSEQQESGEWFPLDYGFPHGVNSSG
jgi:hypothetical protein